MNTELLSVLNTFARVLNLLTKELDNPVLLQEHIAIAMRETEGKMQQLELTVLDGIESWGSIQKKVKFDGATHHARKSSKVKSEHSTKRSHRSSK